MGNYIKVPNSDFSLVRVDKVTISEDPIVYTWAEVDLSKETNKHFIVYNSFSTFTDGYLYGPTPNNDAYILPVIPGEKYKIRCCSAHDAYCVVDVSSDAVPTLNGNILPYPAFVAGILSVPQEQVTTGFEAEFVIPTRCYYININGRNSGHASFVAGYELKLYKQIEDK